MDNLFNLQKYVCFQDNSFLNVFDNLGSFFCLPLYVLYSHTRRQLHMPQGKVTDTGFPETSTCEVSAPGLFLYL